jgi:hypothetical protein
MSRGVRAVLNAQTDGQENRFMASQKSLNFASQNQWTGQENFAGERN